MRPRNFGLRVNEPGATEGFTLYSPLWRPKTFLLNMDGEVVHEWDLETLVVMPVSYPAETCFIVPTLSRTINRLLRAEQRVD